ncbi:hypothetical protein A0128_06565 [Leptospira tipperaryensis]|uniref:Uncharacterized protein n=1 Tax=Leptospira tipperaryensis TaxID=2564040 RepID=A0A1D7UVA6_9LEPT|nr:hypothetical protein [Leptospira tipperaryensis]AOP33537.1 hypothetical protein A0128_06565 [Leptospira tipperaryensis]
MKDKNQYLLDCYQAAFGTNMPVSLRDMILSGEFIKFSKKDFLHKESNQFFEVELIKDIGDRMGGLVDQSTRISIAEGLDRDEPIAFADLKPKSGGDDFIYNFVVFPAYDEEDPCAVYLLKHKGYPADEFEDEDEDGDEVSVESDLEFELQSVFDSFNELFLSLER